MTKSNRMMNTFALEQNEQLFRCPICTSRMELKDHSQLVCSNNHSFDLSKNGYVNLSTHMHVTKYDKSLFAARKTVIDSGFFNPLLNEINKIVSLHTDGKGGTILDAGCGEGSHLSAILSHVEGLTGVGIDLAKEGIATAAKEHPGIVWCVADLANCPFNDSNFDAILNILSPANYAEFIRILKPNGLFLKVIPESGYLKELRDIFYDDSKPQKDSEHASRFEEHFQAVQTKRITYDFQLDPILLPKLIRMTPLSWGASDEKIERALRMDIPIITVDYNIMIGKRK